MSFHKARMVVSGLIGQFSSKTEVAVGGGVFVGVGVIVGCGVFVGGAVSAGVGELATVSMAGVAVAAAVGEIASTWAPVGLATAAAIAVPEFAPSPPSGSPGSPKSLTTITQ